MATAPPKKRVLLGWWLIVTFAIFSGLMTLTCQVEPALVQQVDAVEAQVTAEAVRLESANEVLVSQGDDPIAAPVVTSSTVKGMFQVCSGSFMVLGVVVFLYLYIRTANINRRADLLDSNSKAAYNRAGVLEVKCRTLDRKQGQQ
jgi:hypothetical protein